MARDMRRDFDEPGVKPARNLRSPQQAQIHPESADMNDVTLPFGKSDKYKNNKCLFERVLRFLWIGVR